MGNKEEPIPGLLDFMASSALSVLSNSNRSFYDEASVAKYCYDVAKAMLIEREKHAITK